MNQKGFTLLEFLIAMALLVFVIAAAYLSQGNSLSSSLRSRNILIATNLARNFISDEELKWEGVKFEALPEQKEGKFEAPNAQFKWTLKFTKVDFSGLSDVLISKTEEGKEDKAQTAMILKMFQDYMEKSVRRMTVTVEWPEGKGNTSMSFTEILVNYDTEFAAGI